MCSAREAGSLLTDPKVIETIRNTAIPVRLLLGHRIDPQHLTYFPEALKVADRLGVRADPAFVIVAPDGKVRWKQVGMVGRETLLKALCSNRQGRATRDGPCGEGSLEPPR